MRYVEGWRNTLARNSPSWICRSVPQTPAALTLTYTDKERPGVSDDAPQLKLTPSIFSLGRRRTKTSFSRSLGSGTSTTLNSLGLLYLHCRERPALATDARTVYEANLSSYYMGTTKQRGTAILHLDQLTAGNWRSRARYSKETRRKKQYTVNLYEMKKGRAWRLSPACYRLERT